MQIIKQKKRHVHDMNATFEPQRKPSHSTMNMVDKASLANKIMGNLSILKSAEEAMQEQSEQYSALLDQSKEHISNAKRSSREATRFETPSWLTKKPERYDRNRRDRKLTLTQ